MAVLVNSKQFKNPISGSFTGSFVGNLTGTASYATTASYLIGQSPTASYALTASYVQNAQTASYVLQAQSASYWSGSITNAATASYALTASFATTASYVTGQSPTASYALTASYADNFTVGNTLTAQRIVVQTISSSVEFASGSNRFGNDITNTQTFTGSVGITGSLTINGGISILNTPTVSGQVIWGNSQYYNSGVFTSLIQNNNNSNLIFRKTDNTPYATFFNLTGNLTLQNGGTLTDNGYKLQVNGTSFVSGALWISGSSVFSGSVDVNSNLTVNGTSTVVPTIALNAAGASSNNQFFDFRISNNSKFQFGYTQSPPSGNRFFIYNSILSQDSIRIIESTNNVAIGYPNSITDTGFRLDVSGSTRLNGSLLVSGPSVFSGSVDVSGSLTTYGTIYSKVSSSSAPFISIGVNAGLYPALTAYNSFGTPKSQWINSNGNMYFDYDGVGGNSNLNFRKQADQDNLTVARFVGNGNLLLQNAGNYVDNGFKLQIQPSGSISGSLFVSGSSVFSGSVNVSGSILQNGGALAVQDGTILYSPTRAYTPTGSISTSGTTVTTVGSHFDSGMVGMKLTISGESRIITTYTSTTQVSVDSAYSQNYSGVAASSWGVYYKVFEVKTDGYPYFYLGNQSGGATPGSTFIYNNGGFPTTQYGFQVLNNFLLNSTGLNNASNTIIRWSPGNPDPFGSTNDLGIRRNNAGVLEIYDGNTRDGALANRRDLLVRNITGSNAVFSGSVNVSGSLTTTGTITAQTLVVQTISSSVEYSSGSNVFGSLLSNTHQFTGSVGMTGSLSVIGASAFSGSVNIVSGSLNVASASLAISGSLSINGVNITATGGFQQTFSAATTWTAVHNLNTLYPVITVYNSSGQVIIPTSITATDANTTTVTFNVPVAGTINIISGQLQQNIAVSNPTAVALSIVLGG
jgi:cytoskeletal protein CcmA (bactofilin family)